jgi:hypothetical protein
MIMAYPNKPKPIYDAAISYRTPSGRKVRFGSLIAADSLADCETELLARLRNAERFNRRKVAKIIGEFSANFVTMQIGKGN